MTRRVPNEDTQRRAYQLRQQGLEIKVIAARLGYERTRINEWIRAERERFAAEQNQDAAQHETGD